MIRKFTNNTSEMKRLAACDFEDILQVCYVIWFSMQLADVAFSVPFQFLKDCFQLSMIWLCSLCYIDLHSGMPLLSLGFTRNLHCFFLTKRSRTSPRNCGSFGTTLALPSTSWSYQERKQLVKKGLCSALKFITHLRNQAEHGPRSSI